MAGAGSEARSARTPAALRHSTGSLRATPRGSHVMTLNGSKDAGKGLPTIQSTPEAPGPPGLRNTSARAG